MAQEGGAKPLSQLKSAWHIHVHHWRAAHPDIAYKDALKQAKLTYVSAAQVKKAAKPVKVAKVKKTRARAAPGVASTSPWIRHIKAYQAEHGVSYKEAMSKAGATYKKGPTGAEILTVASTPARAAVVVKRDEIVSIPELKEEIKAAEEAKIEDEEREQKYDELEEKIKEEAEDEGILDLEIDKAAETRAREYAMRKVIQQLDKEEEAAGNAEAFQYVLNVIYDYIGRYTDADARKTDAELFNGSLFFKGSVHDAEDGMKVTAIYHQLKKDVGKLVQWAKEKRIRKIIKWVRRLWKDDPKILKLGLRPLTKEEREMAEKALERDIEVKRDEYKVEHPELVDEGGWWLDVDDLRYNGEWQAIERWAAKEEEKLRWAAKGMSVPRDYSGAVPTASELTDYGKERQDVISMYNWQVTQAQGRPLTEKQVAERDAKLKAIDDKYAKIIPGIPGGFVKNMSPYLEQDIRNWEGTAQAYRSMGKVPPLPRPSETIEIKGTPERREYPAEHRQVKNPVRLQYYPHEIKAYRRGHMGSGRTRCECGKILCGCARANRY